MGRFAERSVCFAGGDPRVELAGTVTLPVTAGPWPAAVLLHGQGALDRDTTLAHLKPFRTLAHHLAKGGVASLRYDKRGVGASSGDFASADLADFAADAQAALRYLRSLEEIGESGAGLIGASEGGLVTLRVAAASREVRFAVLLAGPVLPGRENLCLSFARFAQASEANELSIAEFCHRMRRLLEVLLDEPLMPEARSAALRLAAPLARHIVNPRTAAVLGGKELTPDQLIHLLSSECLRDILASEPAADLALLSCPLLALFAEKDKHVPAEENGAAATRVLATSGNLDAIIEIVPGCNHLFQCCETGFPDEYFTLDHDIAPQVLDRVTEWIIAWAWR